jgi:hypothetical protein
MTFGYELIDACLAHGHDREFGRDEKAVGEDERQYAAQAPHDARKGVVHHNPRIEKSGNRAIASLELLNPITRLPDYPITRAIDSGFAVGEKVGVDEAVDQGLAG